MVADRCLQVHQRPRPGHPGPAHGVHPQTLWVEVNLYSDKHSLLIEEAFDLDRHTLHDVGLRTPLKHGIIGEAHRLAIDFEGVVRRQATGNGPFQIDEEINHRGDKDASFIEGAFDLDGHADRDVGCVPPTNSVSLVRRTVWPSTSKVLSSQAAGDGAIDLDASSQFDFLCDDDAICVKNAFDLDAHVDRDVIGLAGLKYRLGGEPYGLAVDFKGVAASDRG